MDQSPSWEADSHSASQEIPRHSWNPKIHFRVHKSPPMVPTPIQMNPVQTFPPYFRKIYSRIIIPSTPRFRAGTATRVWAGRSRFYSWRRLGIFLIATASGPALGSTQTPMQWIPEAFSFGVKLPGREADHSPPSSAEVKTTWSYTSTPPYAFTEQG
jgi:hypothetical protein